MARDSIFLSGWEFNRLTLSDPTAPIQSALPGGALWNGGAQFWLFKKAFCSAESFQYELRMADELGFAQGQILRDLKEAGMIHLFDWRKFAADSPFHHRLFCEKHRELKEKYGERLHAIVHSANDIELEAIKAELLKPVLDYTKSCYDVTSNSLRHWYDRPQDLTSKHLNEAFALLSAPIEAGLDFGVPLCSHPGANASAEQRHRLEKNEREIQKPRIPYLLANELAFEDYIETLKDHRSVYDPINEMMLLEWTRNRDSLFRLRDLAEKHLWSELHGHWIPRLERAPEALGEFKKFLSEAERRVNSGKIAQLGYKIAFAIPQIAAPGLYTALVGPDPAGVIAAAAAGKGVSDLLKETTDRNAKQTESLTMFYQGVAELRENRRRQFGKH